MAVEDPVSDDKRKVKLLRPLNDMEWYDVNSKVCETRCRTCTRSARHWCMVGMTDGFMAAVGMLLGSAMSPTLFAVVMDRLTEEVIEDSSWTMKFIYKPVICSGGQRKRSLSKIFFMLV